MTAQPCGSRTWAGGAGARTGARRGRRSSDKPHERRRRGPCGWCPSARRGATTAALSGTRNSSGGGYGDGSGRGIGRGNPARGNCSLCGGPGAGARKDACPANALPAATSRFPGRPAPTAGRETGTAVTGPCRARHGRARRGRPCVRPGSPDRTGRRKTGRSPRWRALGTGPRTGCGQVPCRAVEDGGVVHARGAPSADGVAEPGLGRLFGPILYRKRRTAQWRPAHFVK